MVAPIIVIHKISRESRRFLWQGGKTNNKKFHLVNSNMVRAPQNKSDMGIKDPTIMNISMGAKLIWRLIIGKLDWWK
jgi:hypothetical protein